MSADRTPVEETLRFVELFAGKGATAFCMSYLPLEPIEGGPPRPKHRNRGDDDLVSLAEARLKLPEWIAKAVTVQESIAIRPRGQECYFLQLDDLGECDETGKKVRSGDDPQAKAVRDLLRPYSFLELQTSWKSWQFWFALPSEGKDSDKEFGTYIKRAAGANVPANGSVRSAGGYNFKEKHLTANGYPLLRVKSAVNADTTRQQLAEALGVSPELPKPLKSPTRVSIPLSRSTSRLVRTLPRIGSQKWPDYAKCVEYGKQRGDRDLGDHRFAWIAAARGFSLDEVASELMRISPRAAEDGDPDRYCRRKAEAGAKVGARYVATHSKSKGAQKPFARSQTPVRGKTPLVDSVTSFGKPSRSIAPPALGTKRSKLKGAQKPLGRSITPVRGKTALVDSATGPGGPPRPNAGTKGKVRSRVLAICSTREDAIALQEATGIRAVRISLKFFPVKMQLRCALRRVIIATRQDKSGEALARRIVETCTLSTLKRIPWPPGDPDKKALFALFSEEV